MSPVHTPEAEHAGRGLSAVHELGRELRILRGGSELLRYVYEPDDHQLESPRPYFAPLRTVTGHDVSLYRPHDHVWHKGLAWSLPQVGGENFWGGPTYARGRGYVQRENNGSMRHGAFPVLDATAQRVSVEEDLTWVTASGRDWIAERRAFSVAPIATDDRAWLLTFSTRLRNVSGTRLVFGSPATEGRDDVGYGGLFWRGPRSFTGGDVHAPGRTGGDDLNGIRSPWVAFCGLHDIDDGASTLVFVDAPSGPERSADEHTEWFVRTELYAGVSASPFCSAETKLGPSDSVFYEYAVVIADGDRGLEGSTALAAAAREAVVAAGQPDAPGAPD